jgi:hypothetical protein
MHTFLAGDAIPPLPISPVNVRDGVSPYALRADTVRKAPRTLRQYVQEILVGAFMIDTVLNLLFRCPHRRLTRPVAPITKAGQSHSQSYVVCLDCRKNNSSTT